MNLPPARSNVVLAVARALLACAVLATAAPLAHAQYFGQNKPRYERFDWSTYQTPHFLIYNYLERPTTRDSVNARLAWIGQLSESWYAQHRRVLDNDLPGRNLMLLYNNHADFQQTNAIQGGISTGTGGVTEAFKNRVIFPFALSNHQTDHVLGHELVHAFQYDIVLNGDSTNIQNLGNLPLWMVEGLAEYLSIGRVDAHTSMWMRDAVLHDDVPTMRKLNNPKYFPYRWGQAWWAFVTGLQGDGVIRPLFESTAKYGLERAVARELGMRIGQLDTLWVQSLERHYEPFTTARADDEPPGSVLIDEDDGGTMNIAPVVSPDGRYVIFLSEKNLFSIDLFLADARTGEVIRQVTERTRGGHIDDFAFVESAGTWDPKSDRFAYVAVSKGRNVLVVSEVERGRTIEEYSLGDLQAFDNPTWSPDGKSIVVSGLVEGQVDLFRFTLATGTVERLTNSFASELLPSFDATGERIVFAQDAARTGARLGASQGFDIAVLDLATGAVSVVETFPGADNLNPGFDDAGDIVFLSNADGYRDLYRVRPSTGELYRLTRLATGVSGITAYAPAISASPRRDRTAYTVLTDGEYTIYSAKRDEFLNEPVTDRTVDLAAATLPTLNRKAPLAVDPWLQSRPVEPSELAEAGFADAASRDEAGALPAGTTRPGAEPQAGDGIGLRADSNYAYTPLRNPFRLDFIGGGAGVGTSIGNPGLGTQFGAAGGINALFSDVLGGRQLFAGVSLNGRLVDAFGQFAYVNRERPWGYGASFSHVPYRAGSFVGGGVLDTIPNTSFQAIRYDVLERRVFEDRLGVFVDRPFSRTLRIEGGASFAIYNTRQDVTQLYYDGIGRLVAQDRRRDREADLPGFNLGSVSAAVVGDNAIMGLASPLQGYRFRLGAEQVFGEFQYTQSTVDGRVYHRLRPFTFAARLLHYGRHGLGDQRGGLLFPFYVGNQFFVRGLSNQGEVNALGSANNFNFNALVGNNLGVVNGEIRLPFTGPRRLALIPVRGLYTELTAFVDGGLAYDDFTDVRQYYRERDSEPDGGVPSGDFASLSRPLFSAGFSLRANVFGALIVEPYYARVINADAARWRFGVNLVPGW